MDRPNYVNTCVFTHLRELCINKFRWLNGFLQCKTLVAETIFLQPVSLHLNNDNLNIVISEGNIATRTTADYQNALISLPELRSNHFIIIQILEIDSTCIGGVRLYQSYKSEKKLLHADLTCKCKDCLIVWANEDGELYCMKNDQINQLAASCSVFELVIDLYGSAKKLRVFTGQRTEKSTVYSNTQLQANSSDSSSPSSSVEKTNNNEDPYIICYYSDRYIRKIEEKISVPDFSCSSEILIPKGWPQDANKSLGDPKISHYRSSCVICMSEEAKVVLIPCGHMCSCYNCAERIRTRFGNVCPICRADIKLTQKIYRS